MPRYHPCTCGHALTAHSTCEHKKYRRGSCKGYLPVPVDIQQCPCEQYTPVHVNANALTDMARIEVRG